MLGIWLPYWIGGFFPYSVLALVYEQDRALASIGILP